MPAASEQPVGELTKQASQQVAELVRAELRLAVAETREKGRHAGFGAGMFGGAGLVALYGAAALLASGIAALSLVIPVWAAALIVGLALLAVAAVLWLTGRRQVSQATPPVPEQAMEGAKRDVAEIKERARR